MLQLSQRKICLFFFSEKRATKKKIFDYARGFTVVIDSYRSLSFTSEK